jgi:hypothetical protein
MHGHGPVSQDLQDGSRMNAGKRVRAAGLLPLLMVAVQACSDSGASAPLALALSSAGELQQTAPVGTTVQPSVVLQDERGRARAGVQVAFEVTAGGGSLAAGSAATDAAGRAMVAWTLGTQAGTNTVVARASGSAVTFSVTAAAVTPSQMAAVGTIADVSPAGGAVTGTPSVRVTDRYGNPVGGVRVDFSTGGIGSVAVPVAETNASGVATGGVWTTGPEAGDQTLTAQAAGLPAVTFTTRAIAVTGGGLVIARLGGHQTTCPVNTAGCSFSVHVTNQGGAPVPGEAVLWTGGPDGATTLTTTNLNGLASAPNQGARGTAGSYTQTARLVATGEEVTFAYSLVPAGGFQIELRFLSDVSPSVRTAFEQAKARWESVITGNLLEFPLTGANQVAANACGITHPAVSEVVDDVLILIDITPIDGPGQVLGSAGPCMIRGGTGLPILGVMKLDSDDLARMDTNGSLRDVILHEIGHVLGIGTLWSRSSLVQGAGSADPFYTGLRAQPGFVLAGGTILGGIPLENTGGSGTRDAHWRETTMRNELMTGWINTGANPLSAITIGSLMDLGYQVNFGAADTWSLPFGNLQAHAGPLAGAEELKELPLPAPRTAW